MVDDIVATERSRFFRPAQRCLRRILRTYPIAIISATVRRPSRCLSASQLVSQRRRRLFGYMQWQKLPALVTMPYSEDYTAHGLSKHWKRPRGRPRSSQRTVESNLQPTNICLKTRSITGQYGDDLSRQLHSSPKHAGGDDADDDDDDGSTVCPEKRGQKYFYITLTNSHVSLEFLSSNIVNVLGNYIASAHLT